MTTDQMINEKVMKQHRKNMFQRKYLRPYWKLKLMLRHRQVIKNLNKAWGVR